MPEHPGMTTSASNTDSLPRSLAHALALALALALLTLSGVACAIEPTTTSATTAPDTPPTAPATGPRATSLMAAVTKLIGEAACDNQGQCHAIGVGAKACGGPGGYLAWSDKTTDANALRSAVEAQARAQVEENKSSGLLSNCMVVPEPPAVCRPRASDGKKTCQLGQGGASSAV